LVVLAIVLLAALVYGFMALTGLAKGRSGTTNEFGHIHGLGIDPADNSLYVATHHGLFRYSSQGKPVLVADRVRDFMGFTVVGPRHFLASGHPGELEGGPSSLGLIESTDAGNTWTSLSLSGAADFHALEEAGGRIYGFNSITGEFVASADKKTWPIRTQLAMADLAISPDNPDIILATTEQGLMRSTDGGRSFTSMPGPRLLLVDWPTNSLLVGIIPDGSAQVSNDGGGSWQPRGNLGGAPEALHVAGTGEIYAAVDGRVVVSDDEGRTFNDWAQT
jgi:hypothetical protein